MNALSPVHPAPVRPETVLLARHTMPPPLDAAKLRLAGLSLAGMPWLRADIDLTPPDGGPEVCGSR